ncbi:MAG: hypothetical protein U0235_26760 [Polyangiaceae bacterium]
MRILRAAVPALALLLAASCTEDPPLVPLSEEVPLPTPLPPPQDASATYDVAACTACIAKTCVPEHVRCYEEPGCVTIVECANTLNCNQECINRCWFNQVGFGRREYQALSTCEFEASCGPCNDVCGKSDLCVVKSPAPADAAAPAVPVTCGGCMRERCADTVKKCEPGTPCADYFACTNPCLPPRDACVASCGTKFPQGKADAEATLACEKTTCKAQCTY